MGGVSGPLVHALPAQLPIVEWGPGDGTQLPLAGQAFDSGFFDVWRLAPEDIAGGGVPVPIVSTDDPGFATPGELRRAGVYLLDVVCRHHNNAGLALTITVEEMPAPALMTLPFSAFTPRWTMLVSGGQPGASVGGSGLRRSFRIHNRQVRISFTYPASNAIDFYLSAILRSC
jgi:hypothetical protein